MSRPCLPPARLIVLSGPSGVGKDTIIERVRKLDRRLWISLSVTTRTPRPGEQDGVHYRFVDNPTFDAMIAGGELLEWAEGPSGSAGNRYGTPREPVRAKLAEGVPVLLQIDLNGARQVRRTHPDALFVFLTPPSWEEHVRRLTGRGTESAEAIQRRLEVAPTELAAEKEFDVTLVNTDVDVVSRELLALIRGEAP